MAALGNAVYPDPAYDMPEAQAGPLSAVPLALGGAIGPPYDDGSGIPGADGGGSPTTPTTGQIWPRGAP